MTALDERKDSPLEKLFDPEAIAVVGASPDPSKGGHRPLRFLIQHGFQGRIYPINPKYQKIGDFKCYATLLDIPDPVDAVMITVPENQVLGVLRDCVEKEVKLVIIRTAFLVIGEARNKQKPVGSLELIRDSGLRIMGPSSLGFVNVQKRIAAYFHISLSMEGLIPGRIGLISQSGGLSGVIFNKVQDCGVGFSYLFSTGIETDLETADFIDFLIRDPHTHVISCFVEGFKDPERILPTFQKAAEVGKPVIVMKVGRSDLGMRAAKSHTGKMVGRDQVWNAIFKQRGVARVETIEELVETSSLFAKCKKPKGERIGILAASGGAITTLADQAGIYKLNLPALSSHTQTRLRKILPAYASTNNPVDISPVGDERYLECLEVISTDENIDVVLLPLTIVVEDFGSERARKIVKLQNSIRKQLIILWLGGSLVSTGMKIIEESEIPLFRSEEICIKALKAFTTYARFQGKKGKDKHSGISNGDRNIMAGLIRREGRSEGISVDKSIFARFGIPITREGVASSPKEAIEKAHVIGYPVALKVLSPQVIHKTDFGAVRLNIQGDRELEESYAQIIDSVKRHDPGAEIRGVLVQEMIANGTEVLLGMNRDSQIGPVLTCGLGGVFVEAFKDIATRIPPLTPSTAKEMIEELKGFEVLKGFRGKKKSDINTLIQAIVRFSHICVLLADRVSEIEINPLILLEKGKGVKAVDSRILWKKPPAL